MRGVSCRDGRAGPVTSRYFTGKILGDRGLALAPLARQPRRVFPPPVVRDLPHHGTSLYPRASPWRDRRL